MSKKTSQFIYLIASLITLLVGYAYLRYAYKVTDSTPFTQEIVLIILGTVATIFITALLLNKQTAVEIEKEQSIKFLELKAHTYEKLLDLIENMSVVEQFSSAEFTRLQFITHRLAIVASADVLNEYQHFIKVLSKISVDRSFTNDTEELSQALSALTVQIRQDLIGSPSSSDYTKKQIKEMITQNSYTSSIIKLAKKK